MTRRVMLQSVVGPSPILQDAPLPSQKTWIDMMSRLQNKYSQQRKKITRKSRSSKKKKTRRRPTKAKKQTYQSILRSMTTKPRRGKKTATVDLSLLELVQAFPGANRKLTVYLNRSSLCSIVCPAQGAKKQTVHLFVKKGRWPFRSTHVAACNQAVLFIKLLCFFSLFVSWSLTERNLGPLLRSLRPRSLTTLPSGHPPKPHFRSAVFSEPVIPKYLISGQRSLLPTLCPLFLRNRTRYDVFAKNQLDSDWLIDF